MDIRVDFARFWCFYKNFIQIIRALVIKVSEGNGICTLIIFFFNGQPTN